MGDDLEIPPEYAGGEQLMVVAQEYPNGDKTQEKLSEEDQKKQIEEAKKHAEEKGGFIFNTATLYPGFSVAFKPDTVHALEDVKGVTHEPTTGTVSANK